MFVVLTSYRLSDLQSNVVRGVADAGGAAPPSDAGPASRDIAAASAAASPSVGGRGTLI